MNQTDQIGICICCGDPLEPPKVKYCSTTCANRATYRRLARRPVSDWAFDAGELTRCEECDRVFTRYLPTRRYCSDRCRVRACYYRPRRQAGVVA